MKRIKGFLTALFISFVLIFSGFGIKKPVASAIDFQMSYDEFSAEIGSVLTGICGFKTRIAGSENEKAAALYIKDYLTNNVTGIQSRTDASTDEGIQSFSYISSYDGNYKNSQNVIFEYKAAQKTNKKVVIACNYDAPVKYDEDTKEFSTYNNDAFNASAAGVASMIVLAEILPNYGLNYNIEFVFFGAGEDGFAGSEFYLNGLSEEDAKDVLCVINLDKVALGNNVYFYMDEIQTKFSKYVSEVCVAYSKPVDITHLNKTEYVQNGLGLGYSHIGLESDNVNFMKRGIATINIFAGDYESGIIMGRSEYDGKVPITYSSNDTMEYIDKNIGRTKVLDNLYLVNSSIESLLTDQNFVKNASKSYKQTAWFYNIFANEELVVLLTIIAFIIILIVAMYVYYKLTVKSYYANVELEFLSSVVKISEQIDNNQGNKDVAKVIGKVLANDIKKNKTLDPEKKKKSKK